MTFPLTNATLTQINAAGGEVDEYLQPLDDATVPPLWTGSAAGYLKRVKLSAQSKSDQIKGATDSFTILDTAMAPVIAVAGPEWNTSNITILDQRVDPPVEITFEVVGIEHRATGSIADSVRLELNRASA